MCTPDDSKSHGASSIPTKILKLVRNEPSLKFVIDLLRKEFSQIKTKSLSNSLSITIVLYHTYPLLVK